MPEGAGPWKTGGSHSLIGQEPEALTMVGQPYQTLTWYSGMTRTKISELSINQTFATSGTEFPMFPKTVTLPDHTQVASWLF